MCKLFSDHEREIKEYCLQHNLNFEKAKKMPQSWGKSDIWLQYYDSEKGKSGLLDETPAPIVLKISVGSEKLSFEQTEHTKKYLSL